MPADRRIVGAEVGVWSGGMSEKLLEALPNLYLYCIDRWRPPEPHHPYYGSDSKMSAATEEDFKKVYETFRKRIWLFSNRVVPVKNETWRAARLFSDRVLDFAFIDADHTYAGCLLDLLSWWPKVRDGGWLCGHDWDHPDQGQVKMAVTDFLEERVERVELDVNRTWFYKKLGGER
jgi:hypothetical protein